MAALSKPLCTGRGVNPLDAGLVPRQSADMALIYKIFRQDEYVAFAASGETKGAPVDLADGYIHISTADQVAETAARHFGGDSGLKLLALDADTLGDTLIWEPSRGGALFPHLYRALKAADVVWARDLPFENGVHRFDGLLD